MIAPLLGAGLGAWWAPSAEAQTADDRWHTLRTEHFRVHYPDQASAWALDAASHLESWHARVVAEVGWTPTHTIDAVVVDPFSDANGYALPFAGAPKTAWFTTPPEAASDIGYYRQWDEELIVHEDTHLVHLMRAPRNPGARLLYDLFGFSPMLACPRWVTEGYATVVEGRLTGFGRPNGDGRAILLRSLAQRGELPSYGELDSNGRWGGGGYAYLVGSAYLEWLEQRAGVGSLRNLWARMTARQTRSFDQAFEGVFGDSAPVLYARFTAELTASAMVIEAEEPPDSHLFQKIGWTVTSSDVASDGSKVAVARFPRTGSPEVDVYALAVDQKAVDEREKDIADALEADPEDVAPVAPAAAPHERTEVRRNSRFAAREVRWAPDGAALYFTSWTWDPRGRVRPDLYRWTIDGARTERLTRHADLRTPDPSPDGTWIAAVHIDWGQSQIVRVDLATGEITPLTPLSLTQVDQPRISPDGKRLAWIENQGAGNGVVVRNLDTDERWQTSPEGGLVAFSLAWSPDGHALLATAGQGGFAEIHEIWRDGALGAGRLSATSGTVVAADPVDATRAIALRPTSVGVDLVEVPLAPRGPTPTGGAAPARRPVRPAAEAVPDAVPVEPHPYGLGHQDLSLFAGFGLAAASRQGQVEVAVRAGDAVGRSLFLLTGGYAADRGGAYGARLSWTYAGITPRLGLDGWWTGDLAYDLHRTGVGLQLDREIGGPWARGSFKGALLADADSAGHRDGTREAAYLGASGGASEPSRGWFGVAGSARGTVGALDGEAYGQVVGAASLQLVRQVSLTYELGGSTGSGRLDRFVLGGLGSSLGYSPGELWRVTDPTYAAGVAAGRLEDRWALSVGNPIALYAERRRIGDTLGGGAFGAVGLRVREQLAPVPMGRLPAIGTDVGLACRVEYPGLGLDSRPCQQLGDYTAWASIVFGR